MIAERLLPEREERAMFQHLSRLRLAVPGGIRVDNEGVVQLLDFPPKIFPVT